jgi:protein ImuB
MGRLACVDVPALPLQLLLVRHPDWRELPVAVVDVDKPLGLILWVNEPARQAGILPGLRYGTALSRCRELRASPVPADWIETGIAELTDRLRRWSPHVEPCADEPGVAWLDAGGLEKIHPSLAVWADELKADLLTTGLTAAVAVGFGRFGVYAVAKALGGRKALVTDSESAEDALVRRVPLQRVGLPPSVRESLHQLGIRQVGEFLNLPADGILRRFGPEAHRLHRFASGALYLPLQPSLPVEPLSVSVDLEYRETDFTRLSFVIKQLLDGLLDRLAQRGEALAELLVHLDLDDRSVQEDRLKPAEPTLASVQIVDLVRLRLEALSLTQPVVGLALTATGVPASVEQLRLFAERPKRDLAAAARALARIRASFGDEAVVTARPQDRHLPEGRTDWAPMIEVNPAQPAPVRQGPLVRRLLAKPEPLPVVSRKGPDGWLLNGIEAGPVRQLHGPFVLSGGWWQRGVERDYYLAEMGDGEMLWVFFDRLRRRWYRQGAVG